MGRGWLRNPWVAALAGVLATVIVTAVFYLASQSHRQLVYSVNTVRTTVVAAGQATALDVFHAGKLLTNTDVTAVQIAIWNAGKGSIRPENVLEDVVIYTNPPVEILELSIRSRSRDVSGFALTDKPELRSVGEVPMSWRILEQGDGASVQLIYAGPKGVEIGVRGTIEGQRGIERWEARAPVSTSKRAVLGAASLGWLAMLAAVVVISVRQYRTTSPPSAIWFGLMSGLVIGNLLVTGAFFVWEFLVALRVPSPPFAF